ncbi:hypothetical protein [Zunongwangia sp. H14]|uniref:hypothetical protein n=1 Tax=Zunongwangia sp. H14 TaxID=3240792 RepID=UPI00356A0411
MKTKLFMLSLLFLSLSSCNAQEKKEKENGLITKKEEPKAVPQGNWKVNKEFDENGNLISYDSTYVYSYSTVDGDTIANGNMDPMLQHFQQMFGSRGMDEHSALFESFMNDSLNRTQDFFNNDFFSDEMSRNFQQQVKQMDSLHQQFLKEHYPQLFYDNRQKVIPRESGTGTI